MTYKAEVYRIMLVSPSDVNKEKDIIREVISEWNVVSSEMRKVVLMPVSWETHSTPEMGNPPQSVINRQILDKCDILIGIFWTRIGTPTDKYPSGSVEEIMKHINANKPAMLYFSSAPVTPRNMNTDQYNKLNEFKNKCKANGLCGEYSDINQFKSKFSKDFGVRLNSILSVCILPLSKEAKKLLSNASESGDNSIMLQANGIQIGGKFIYYEGLTANKRSELECAINELVTNKFIEEKRNKRNEFSLTDAGRKAANEINAAFVQ